MLLNQFLRGSDDAIALVQQDRVLTYGELKKAITHIANWLTTEKVRRIAIAFDNSIAWVVCDLACQQAGVCCVPLPLFFSSSQQQHIMEESQCEYLLTSSDSALSLGAPDHLVDRKNDIVAHSRLVSSLVAMPDGTEKITFTSGSTGAPKGVCLSTQSQWKVAQSIDNAVSQTEVNHLCLLPLSTLLENIAGVYAPLLRGGKVNLATLDERGFQGSKLVNTAALLRLIDNTQPTSVIIVPDLLLVLLQACHQGWTPPASLTFIAVGGAHVAPHLLQQAHANGLPVYEGYGLSEAVSVSTLNTPNNHRPGTAGKSLGHNALHIDNGEVVVTGNHFLGYLNQPDSFYPSAVRTGDLGYFDSDFLTLNGRKKNIMVNSFGRNVSPEWIESLLMGSGLFRQVLVFCEAKPYCVALLTPVTPNVSHTDITKAISQINHPLPDYAQVMAFDTITPCTSENGLLTETGKIKRAEVLSRYSDQIDALYSSGDSAQCPEARALLTPIQ